MWNLDQKPLDQLAFAIWSENIVFHKDDVLSGENMVFINTKLNFYFDGLGIHMFEFAVLKLLSAPGGTNQILIYRGV